MIELSVVIPIFNEEGNISILYKELKTVLEKSTKKYEIIFVNDCSTDLSPVIIKKITTEDPCVRFIQLVKNSGQGVAITKGVYNSNFSNILMIDGDLQNNPTDIPKLIKVKLEGYSLVNGKRSNRSDSFYKKTQSFAGNLFFRTLFKYYATDIGCGIKIFDKNCFENIKFQHNIHRYLPILFHIHGYKTKECLVSHRPRVSGKSKYGLKRYAHVLIDIIRLIKYKSN